MNISRIKLICTLFAIIVPLFTVSTSSGSMLPDDLVIVDEFKPGYGLPVGKVLLLQGEVVVMHADQLRGYWAIKGLPLYQGDTIVTMETGRVRFNLKDGSVLTLTSDTKMTINISVYDTKKKIRSSFFNMVIGKVLFLARKLSDFKSSQYKVKTLTAVVGVRGSQWVEEVTEDSTTVTALENTTLGVISTAYPEVEPTILKDFDQTIVYEGQLPSKVVKVSNKELKQFEKDFTITPEEGAEEYKGKEGPVAEGYEEVSPEVFFPVEDPDLTFPYDHEEPDPPTPPLEDDRGGEVRKSLADFPRTP